VTTLAPPELPAVGSGDAPEPGPPRQGLLDWITSTDHKVIGKSYIYTSFVFFLFGGLLAELLRTQLSSPTTHSCRPRPTTRSSPSTARS